MDNDDTISTDKTLHLKMPEYRCEKHGVHDIALTLPDRYAGPGDGLKVSKYLGKRVCVPCLADLVGFMTEVTDE